MKLLFSLLLITIPLLANAQWEESLIRKSAIKSGYKLPTDINADFDSQKSLLGKIFFETKMLSFNGDTSCSSCHIDKFSSADGLPNAVGVGGHGEGFERLKSNGDIVPRNTLALWGRGSRSFQNFFWDDIFPMTGK